MEKNITIKDFVSGLTALDNEDDMLQYLKDNLYISPYVKFFDKLQQATIVARLANFKVDETGYPTSYAANSALEYVWAQISMIHLYTNLIVDNETAIEDYDLLAETGILKTILEVMPEDAKVFDEILYRTTNDLEKNWNEPHQFIDREVKTIGITLQKTLEPVVNSAVEKINNTEPKDLEKLLNRITNKFKSFTE